jgi:hypothetical protein
MMMSDSYPYWPANFRQSAFLIAGRQNVDGIARAAIDCRIPPSNGMTHDLTVIPFIDVPVSKIDAETVAGFRPISGRGIGPGLIELMQYSVATTGQRSPQPHDTATNK